MTRSRLKTRILNSPTSRTRAGFSLMEIMIVIALIAMLAGVVIVGMDGLFSGGQENIAETFVATTGPTALMGYRLAMGGYPNTDLGLEALRKAPANAGSKWKGPYLKKDPLDPWQNPYQYKSPGTHNPSTYDLWSLGPDGKEGTDDIGNWENE